MIGDLLRQPDMRPSGSKGVEALQSMMGVPLISRNEEVGALVWVQCRGMLFSAEDLNLLNMIAGPSATALSMRAASRASSAVRLN